MSLQGKAALVTGSTSGIGLGIARALAEAGASVMLNGFGDAAAIEALRTGMASEFGVKVAYSPTDISKPAEIAAMAAAARAELGGWISWSTTPASSSSPVSRISRTNVGTRSSPSTSRACSTA